MMDLASIYSLFYFSFLFFLLFYFWFLFSFFFILDLSKEYNIMLYMIVTYITVTDHIIM